MFQIVLQHTYLIYTYSKSQDIILAHNPYTSTSRALDFYYLHISSPRNTDKTINNDDRQILCNPTDYLL